MKDEVAGTGTGQATNMGLGFCDRQAGSACVQGLEAEARGRIIEEALKQMKNATTSCLTWRIWGH